MNERAPKSRTLLFAVLFPEDGIEDSDVDPEQVADELVAIINEERERNGGHFGPVEVSGIPVAQWMTRDTTARYRAADAYLAERAGSEPQQ